VRGPCGNDLREARASLLSFSLLGGPLQTTNRGRKPARLLSSGALNVGIVFLSFLFGAVATK
jgi:hypothetical protein